MLLEVLVAILIFAVGVLAVVGLQVSAVKQSGSAKYRADASLLANDLIGRMWAADHANAAMTANFSSAAAGAGYLEWKGRVEAALPGAAASAPTVQISAANVVNVKINWKAPSEPAADPVHSLTITTQIN
jgi:type IV pilus assembly protein PilV